MTWDRGSALTALNLVGLPGATAGARLVGATAAGAPATGTFQVGDVVVDQSGSLWVCTGAGSPGTWTQVLARQPLQGSHKFRAHTTATTNVNASASTQIGSFAADEDPANGFAGNQYTVQAGGAGLWFVVLNLAFPAAATGRAQAIVALNAVATQRGGGTSPNIATDPAGVTATALVRCAVGDILIPVGYQTSAGALAVQGLTSPCFEGVLIAA